MKYFIVVATLLTCGIVHAGTFKPNTYQHIVVVVLENTNVSDAVSESFFKQILNTGASLTNYHAITHPSEPNYIAMIAGDTLGFTNDGVRTVNDQNLADLLEAKNKTWKSYAENYPGNCFLDAFSSDGKYARKHEPFISFSSIQKNPSRCNSHIVDASNFADDIKQNQLPNFSFYVPNLDDDGHDTGVDFANGWLTTTLGPLLKDKKFTDNTLLVVTFDENDAEDDEDNNRIATILVGPGIVAGSTSNIEYNHYSLLRLIEDNFGLGTLNKNDSTATQISQIWQ